MSVVDLRVVLGLMGFIDHVVIPGRWGTEMHDTIEECFLGHLLRSLCLALTEDTHMEARMTCTSKLAILTIVEWVIHLITQASVVREAVMAATLLSLCNHLQPTTSNSTTRYRNVPDIFLVEALSCRVEVIIQDIGVVRDILATTVP
jgi:hypothetical protein